MFKGSYTALITPFKKGKIDWESFEKVIKFQLKNKTDGFVPCGTTGESAVLSFDEHKEVIKRTVQLLKGKKKQVIAGAGSNNTAESIELSLSAQESGADAVLLITPYYNKPTQEGLYRHFKTIASKIKIPVVLYNVPGRTSVNLLPSTVARLAGIKNIKAIKEATGDLKQVGELKRLCGDKIDILSGDDFTLLPLLAMGGSGVISAAGNVIPLLMNQICSYFFKGNIKKSREAQLKAYSVISACFMETNPIPAKTACAMMGLCSDELRLPLCSMSSENKGALRKLLKKEGIIK